MRRVDESRDKSHGLGLVVVRPCMNQTSQAEEPLWQPRFPQLVFSVEARKLIRFNKSENTNGRWKSIFASCHSGSEACAT
jgi:hypothetical protein